MEWFVVRSKSSGKYADGYYGWDGNIHDEEQIFPAGGLPYERNPEMEFIRVARGDKPSVTMVQERLQALAEGNLTHRMQVEGVVGPQAVDPPSRQINAVDLSTSHLPKETVQALEDGTFGFKPMMQGANNWLFGVPRDEETWSRVECEGLKSCLKVALDSGFRHVWFDAAGVIFEELPTYD